MWAFFSFLNLKLRADFRVLSTGVRSVHMTATAAAGCVTTRLEPVLLHNDPLTALLCDKTNMPPPLQPPALPSAFDASPSPGAVLLSGQPQPPLTPVKLTVTPTLSSGGGGRPSFSGASSPQRPRGSISTSFNSIMDSMGLSSSSATSSYSHKNQVRT